MGTPISGYGPPTAKTRAQVGDFYIDQDSQTVYKCTAINPGSVLDYGFIDIHQGHNNECEWEAYTIAYKIKSFYRFCIGGKRLDELQYIDTSGATDMNHMFQEATSLVTAPPLDTSNLESCFGMFISCSGLETVPYYDISNSTNTFAMFRYCNKIKTVPELDFGKSKNVSCMFQGCSALMSAPSIDAPYATAANELFRDCTSLTTISTLNLPNVIYAMSMFQNCPNITTVQDMVLGKVADTGQMFNGCSRLVTVSDIDMNNLAVNKAMLMFNNCKQLTNLTLYNIRASLQIGSGTSWGHLLTVDSLVHTIKELCTVTTQQTLTMGSTNLEKIANLYCKVIDDTTEKIDMELCDSTDEGAMTLAEYAMLKNWVFA